MHHVVRSGTVLIAALDGFYLAAPGPQNATCTLTVNSKVESCCGCTANLVAVLSGGHLDPRTSMFESSIQLFQFLLPGFITAWIFYGLTSYPKENQFERLIQALVFTSIIQSVVAAIKWAALSIGRSCGEIGAWSQLGEVVLAAFLAFLLGLVFANAFNSDRFHEWLRNRGLTKKTGYPSVWFKTLYQGGCNATLQLVDGRRLQGWISQWPSKVEDGHFQIIQPGWLDEGEDGKPTRIELRGVNAILLGADKVEWIEFEDAKEKLAHAEVTTPSASPEATSQGPGKSKP